MNTNGRKQVRYIHISARLATTMVNGNPQTYVVRPGTTFNAGRNAEKRAARAEHKSVRSQMIKIRRDVLALDARVCDRLGGEPTKLTMIPKAHASKKVVAMLSDRRLRQRGGEGYATRIAEAA